MGIAEEDSGAAEIGPTGSSRETGDWNQSGAVSKKISSKSSVTAEDSGTGGVLRLKVSWM